MTVSPGSLFDQKGGTVDVASFFIEGTYTKTGGVFTNPNKTDVIGTLSQTDGTWTTIYRACCNTRSEDFNGFYEPRFDSN